MHRNLDDTSYLNSNLQLLSLNYQLQYPTVITSKEQSP
jgi:hypothetical protein